MSWFSPQYVGIRHTTTIRIRQTNLGDIVWWWLKLPTITSCKVLLLNLGICMKLLPKHLPCHPETRRLFPKQDRNLLTLQGGIFTCIYSPELNRKDGILLVCGIDASGSPNGPGGWNSCRDKTSPTPSAITQRKDLPSRALCSPLCCCSWLTCVSGDIPGGLHLRPGDPHHPTTLHSHPRQTQAPVNRLIETESHRGYCWCYICSVIEYLCTI